MKNKDLDDEILRLVCDTSDGTVSAIDAAYEISALLTHTQKELLDRLESEKEWFLEWADEYGDRKDVEAIPLSALEEERKRLG